MFRILHIFSTFAVGGPQIRTIDLALALGNVYSHCIVATDNDLSAAIRLQQRIPLITPQFTRPLRKGPGLALANIRHFRTIISEYSPDLLLTYNWGAIEAVIASRLRSVCPHVHFEDGFGPEETVRQLRRRIWTRRFALSGRHTFVVVPSHALERIAVRRWCLPAAHVLRIPNGIDLHRFAPADPQASAPQSCSNEILIGAVGALRPEKNIARLLRIVARMPKDLSIRLMLVGDGGQRESLEAMTRELGIAERVVFTGSLEQPELVLRRLSVFVLSSDTEQMPYSLLEAMACGLPVVATDVGDVRMMLPERSREWVVSATDEVAFAARLECLLRDADLRRNLGERHRAHAAAHFGLDTMTRCYDALFRSLIAGKSAIGGQETGCVA